MLLSLIVWSPLFFGLAILMLPKAADKGVRIAAVSAALINLAVVIAMVLRFQTLPSMQFEENYAWYELWNIRYHLGVDGVSVFLVAVNAGLTLMAILCSWTTVKERVKEFHFLLLMLQTAIYGVFLSQDGFLFYLFWEAALIPMYFLIGAWGGERRIYATTKFVLYTLAGSLLMLLAMIKMASLAAEQTHSFTFSLEAWRSLQIDPSTQRWLFLAFVLAFAIKVPLFPLHTWLPDTYQEAPIGVVLLSLVMVKMGAYGIMRFCLPVFPEAAILYQKPLEILALIGILYGAVMVLVQVDLKRMIAYSSISHMGLCLLGIFSFTLFGQQGGLLTMVNHSISTGALFAVAGIFYERVGSGDLSLYGGAVKKMPFLGLLFLPIVLSSMGVPGTNGFVDEFLSLRGAFRYDPVLGALAALVIILGAAYMLRLAQKLMFGPLASPAMEVLTDINAREAFILITFVILIFILGVFPNLVLHVTEPSVNQGLLELMRASAPGS